MKIPSYDDLTPGIADVHPRDTFHGAAGMLPGAEAPVVPHVSAPRGTPHFAPGTPHRTSHLAPGTPHRMSHVAPGMSDVAPGTSHVAPGMSDVAPGTSHVAPGMSDVAPGMSDVAPGTSHLAPGMSDVAPGTSHLAPGMSDVAPGTSHLAPHVAPGTSHRTSHAAPRTSHVLFACVRARGATAAGLLALAKDFSPRLERHGSGAIVLDVSGLGRLLGDAHGIAAALQQAAVERGLEARIAVAPTQIAVRLLTLQHEIAVVRGDVAAALAVLPLDLLQTENGTDTDVDRKASRAASLATVRTFDALRRWGLRTMGEFAALPADELAARFGAAGVALQALARGADPHPLVPDPGVPRFVESMELEWPLDQLEPLSFVLARLLDPLSAALEQADRGAAAIHLDLRLVDRTIHTRVLQLPAPMRDPRVLRTLLLLDLESHSPAAAIDIVTIEIDPAPGRIVQFSLLERAIPSPETLATLTARLGALVGEDRCGAPVLIDSYRPDAFEVRPFHPRERAPLRLPRTLESPNPGTIEPQHPARLASPAPRPLLLRRFRPPVAVRVAIDRGRPVTVAIDRRGMPGGRVEQAAGPWRTSGAWWDTTGGHWDRDEWEVALSDGSVCSLYQDRETARWFLHGVFD